MQKQGVLSPTDCIMIIRMILKILFHSLRRWNVTMLSQTKDMTVINYDNSSEENFMHGRIFREENAQEEEREEEEYQN